MMRMDFSVSEALSASPSPSPCPSLDTVRGLNVTCVSAGVGAGPEGRGLENVYVSLRGGLNVVRV